MNLSQSPSFASISHPNTHQWYPRMVTVNGPIDSKQANWSLRQDWRLFSTVPETRSRLRRNKVRNNSWEPNSSAASTKCHCLMRTHPYISATVNDRTVRFVQRQTSLCFKQTSYSFGIIIRIQLNSNWHVNQINRVQSSLQRGLRWTDCIIHSFNLSKWTTESIPRSERKFGTRGSHPTSPGQPNWNIVSFSFGWSFSVVDHWQIDFILASRPKAIVSWLSNHILLAIWSLAKPFSDCICYPMEPII